MSMYLFVSVCVCVCILVFFLFIISAFVCVGWACVCVFIFRMENVFMFLCARERKKRTKNLLSTREKKNTRNIWHRHTENCLLVGHGRMRVLLFCSRAWSHSPHHVHNTNTIAHYHLTVVLTVLSFASLFHFVFLLAFASLALSCSLYHVFVHHIFHPFEIVHLTVNGRRKRNFSRTKWHLKTMKNVVLL